MTRIPNAAPPPERLTRARRSSKRTRTTSGSLRRAFREVNGLFNVQNPMTSSLVAEVRQGGHVADAAGVGVEASGVGSCDSKLAVAARFRDRTLQDTVLRPMATANQPISRTWSFTVEEIPSGSVAYSVEVTHRGEIASTEENANSEAPPQKQTRAALRLVHLSRRPLRLLFSRPQGGCAAAADPQLSARPATA
jgi:hypothetical protein